MPYTPTIRNFLNASVRHGDQNMTSFRIVDCTINADYGIVAAASETDALDHIAAKMGWRSYAEYAAAAANHNGVRTLTATQVSR